MAENINTPYITPQPPKKSNKTLLIVIIVLLVLLCCCVVTAAIFYFWLGDPLVELIEQYSLLNAWLVA